MLAGASVFALFFYRSCARGDRTTIRVYFHHAGPLHEGAPLVVGGREVGEVEAIARSPEGAANTPLHGDEGVVASVGIDRATAELVHRGGDVFVASKGPLGDRYLELGATPADQPLYREGDQVMGRDPPSLDRVMQDTWRNLMIAKTFADEVKPEAQAFAVQLAALADNAAAVLPSGSSAGALRDELLGLAVQAKQLRDVELGGRDGLARMAAMVDRLRATIAQGKAMLASLETHADALRAAIATASGHVDGKGAATLAAIDRAIERTRAAIDKIDPLLAQVQALNDRLARGEGSLGRLMKDPEFPEDAKELGKILKRKPWRIFLHAPD